MVDWIMRRAEGDRGKVGELAGFVCIALNVVFALQGAGGAFSLALCPSLPMHSTI